MQHFKAFVAKFFAYGILGTLGLIMQLLNPSYSDYMSSDMDAKQQRKTILIIKMPCMRIRELNVAKTIC